MKQRFTAIVTLKDGLADPQGRAIAGALPHMGWTNVSDVRVGKHIELTIDGDDPIAARAQALEIAEKLLANPVIEDVRVEWEHDGDAARNGEVFQAEVRR